MHTPIRKISGLFLVFFILSSIFSPAYAANIIKNQDIDYITYEEAQQLSIDPRAEGALAEKLARFFTTPIISNEAYFSEIKPHAPFDPRLGPYLRAVSWNIEKSMEVPRVIEMMSDHSIINSMIDPKKAAAESIALETVMRQRERLEKVDIWVLQEMEIGMKRSNYLDATKELAKTLGMNYAFAPQYLEVDPVLLGTEDLFLDDGSEDIEAEDYYLEDPAQFKGVFGSAVLSRYPIKKVEIFPLKHQAYDWYHSEKKNITFLEKARRFGTKTTFKNIMTREMKIGGGRGYFRVDLEVPGLPDNTLTIINIHLEIKCQPKERAAQVQEILEYIKPIKHPVLMMGDFNAAPGDISPTSLTRVLGRTAANPTTWLHLGVNYISPHGLIINTTRTATNLTKNFNDPFASNIKVVAPNKLKAMFDPIRNFRFKDGTTFDFRGDAKRSIDNNAGLLSNSNQRGFKGFKTSFSVKRALGFVGKFRLDWIFVRSGLLYGNKDKNGPYKLAPHFGETLEELNTSLETPLSDHHPNVVDIPFEEPTF